MSISYKRVLAYLLDSLVVYLIAMALSVSPLNPNYEKMVELQDNYEKVTEEYLDAIKEEISDDELKTLNEDYAEYAIQAIYEQGRESIYDNSIMLVLMFFYYVLFAYICGGETLGKRLMHLKIEDADGKRPNIWKLTVRTLVLFGIPFSIINMILPFMMEAEQYSVASMTTNVLSGILSLVIIVMFFAKEDKRSLHDILGKTKVVERK